MKTTVKKICLWVGAGLLVAALVMLLWWQLGIHSSRKQARDYAKTIQSLIPAPQGAVPEERWDNTMAVLSIEGTDFIGILEMPRFESVLPVAADWGKQYPCRFDGSIGYHLREGAHFFAEEDWQRLMRFFAQKRSKG